MASNYRHSILIPFHLTDPAGILFFGHVFTLAHQTIENFVVHQLKCPWSIWFKNQEWQVPIRNADAQYLHPLHAGQDCQIELLVTAISTCSFTLSQSFYQEKLCCIVKTVHVFCDKESKQKIPIPSFLIENLQKHMQI